MNTISPKSRLVATLLVFFVGMLGIHRFYVGKIATGVTQLILTITVIGMIVTSIWVFIDFIRIVAGVFRDKQGLLISEWDPNTPAAAPSTTSEIEKYAALRDKGVITEEDFQAKKKELLGN